MGLRNEKFLGLIPAVAASPDRLPVHQSNRVHGALEPKVYPAVCVARPGFLVGLVWYTNRRRIVQPGVCRLYFRLNFNVWL